MPAPHWLVDWSTIAKDLATVVALIIGAIWAWSKWDFGERLRKRREMPAPDGTLTATAVQVNGGKMVVTLHALWRNRGPFPIELCSKHSIVEAFSIHPAVCLGDLQLQKGCHISLLKTVKPSWETYIMEPNTDSVMHQHFVVDDHFVHGFRWTICLVPESLRGKHAKAHHVCTREFVCTRELMWRADRAGPTRPAAEMPSNPSLEPTQQPTRPLLGR